ncbi:dipeptide epimerase [Nonomuraea sp. NPDC005983]|uniref:mandelate racemase/muconate lactonizing enzyme family protein n=1 Tax=Nonomuraea sp. NPDC005983 TaxID=3155595 RepID=UPI0033B010FB
MESLIVERVDTFVVELPSIRSFSISGGSVTTAGKPAERVLVKVTAGGLTGWGEATPTPAWTYETVESISTTIDRYLAPALVGRSAWDLDGACAAYEKVINRGLTIGSPIAKSALDIALHDLLGRALGVSVGVLWGQRRVDRITLGWIVAGQTPAEVRQAVEEGRAQGYQAYKVKVGLHDEATDVSVVAAVREAAPGAPIWVDANQAYTVDGALRMARRLADLDVSAFEQPLPANDVTGLRRLRDRSPLPVALDESLRHPSDLATFVKLDAVDIAIAKVQRSGGLTLSRRLCQFAEDAGLRIMGSGLTDTDLGFAASLHLFAAFGVDTPVDLNGRQFVHSAYVGGSTVEVVDGTALVPTGPGLGVEVDEDAVRALASAHWSV